MYQDKPPLNEYNSSEESFNDFLIHYGTPRHSGRYPWGSGDEGYQRAGDLLSRIDKYKKTGMSETEIAKTMKVSTTDLRKMATSAKNIRRLGDYNEAKRLRDKEGMTLDQIAEKMGLPGDSSVRSLLNEKSYQNMMMAKNTAEFIKKQINEKGVIDVGAEVEKELGITRKKFDDALYILQNEGYVIRKGQVDQPTNPGKKTTLKVIGPPNTPLNAAYDLKNIHTLADYVSHDSGETYDHFVYPKSFSSKRLKINYAEDGGINKDGLIELRRNVPDLDLGTSHYSQVRILVDGTHYLKGMAMYSDSLPDGCDIMFNTNKSKSVAKMDVLKKIKEDPDNPFGSSIKAGGQSYYIDKNGKKQLSVINKTREEGDWTTWSNSLSSQFLAKQKNQLIKNQLNLSIADRKAELESINALTNPTVKKALLKAYAEGCDYTSVHLESAALPRQKYHVILPFTKIKDTEIYAPNYKDGEKVALIRYPHGGTFEIPVLTVNNKLKDPKKYLGNAADAVGINSKVAERLSGADFDGDTVMVIPTNSKVKITSTRALPGLLNFDPKTQYAARPGMTQMKYEKVDKKTGKKTTVDNTQIEMGKISNLITDMTLRGANEQELERAVKHSMVVIDAAKHKLDYKQSYIDNNIEGLKKDYQGSVDANGKIHTGAGTLLSRAKSQVSIPKTKGSPKIDKDTGEVYYKTDDTQVYNPKTGKTGPRMQKSTRMDTTKDAHTLSSGTVQEEYYANYANTMKHLANQARKEMVSTGSIKYSPTANKTYAKEVDSIEKKLNTSLRNKPKERRAIMLANIAVDAKTQANPDMSQGEIKKLKQRELASARVQVGAKREPIVVTDKEWEAIQSGAIHEVKLKQIIDNIDIDKLRERATPKQSNSSLSSAQQQRIKSMSASGYTTTEIAEQLGFSTSTVSKCIRGVKE